MSTNTFSYTICNAPNVYIFVYILIETRIAPLNLLSFNVLTTIINVPYMADSRLFFIAVTRSFRNNHSLFSLCFDLTHPRTVDLRLPHVTDVLLYVTQQLSIGAFNATVHLRHVERSEFQLTVQET